MPWYYILLLIGVILAPFDALYAYIKAERRKERLRREREAEGKEEEGSPSAPPN